MKLFYFARVSCNRGILIRGFNDFLHALTKFITTDSRPLRQGGWKTGKSYSGQQLVVDHPRDHSTEEDDRVQQCDGQNWVNAAFH
jgi:hypothetical protein